MLEVKHLATGSIHQSTPVSDPNCIDLSVKCKKFKAINSNLLTAIGIDISIVTLSQFNRYYDLYANVNFVTTVIVFGHNNATFNIIILHIVYNNLIYLKFKQCILHCIKSSLK